MGSGAVVYFDGVSHLFIQVKVSNFDFLNDMECPTNLKLWPLVVVNLFTSTHSVIILNCSNIQALV